MIVIRWIRPNGNAFAVKDEEFATKRAALTAVSRVALDKIRRLPTAGGKLYAVTVKR